MLANRPVEPRQAPDAVRLYRVKAGSSGLTGTALAEAEAGSGLKSICGTRVDAAVLLLGGAECAPAGVSSRLPIVLQLLAAAASPMLGAAAGMVSVGQAPQSPAGAGSMAG